MPTKYLAAMNLLRIVLPIALTFTSLAAADRHPEISASLGYRSGGSLDASSTGGPGADADAAPSWGLAVGWWVRPDGWFEVLYDRQALEFEPAKGSTIERFDMSVDYLQFGAGYQPPRDGLSPYVTVAFGLSRYGADPGSVSESTGLSASIGGGFKVPIGKKTLFRLEARGWATLTSSSAAVTCGPGCSFAFSGEGWWQLGVRAAFSFCPQGRGVGAAPPRDTFE
jgi:hypothetical protein